MHDRGSAPMTQRHRRGAPARYALLALRFVGPLLLVALLVWVVDLRKAVRALADADLAWVLCCIAAFHAVMLLRAARWAAIHALFKLGRLGLMYNLRLSYATGIASLVVPQFISPFARFVMLVQDGYPRARSGAAALLEKAGDLCTYVAIGVPGLLYIAAREGHAAYAWAGGAAALAAAVAAAGTMRGRVGGVADFILRRVGPPEAPSAARGVEEVIDSRNGAHLAAFAGTSLATGFLQLIATYVAVRALGLDLAFTYVAAAWGVVALTMLLPISVNGLGTREGVYVAVFAAQGVGREDAFAVSLLVVAASLAAAAPGVLEWLYRAAWPKRRTAAFAPSAERTAESSPT